MKFLQVACLLFTTASFVKAEGPCVASLSDVFSKLENDYQSSRTPQVIDAPKECSIYSQEIDQQGSVEYRANYNSWCTVNLGITQDT